MFGSKRTLTEQTLCSVLQLSNNAFVLLEAEQNKPNKLEPAMFDKPTLPCGRCKSMYTGDAKALLRRDSSAYRTVFSVPVCGTVDVRYGKIACRTGGRAVRYGEIGRTGNEGTVRYGNVRKMAGRKGVRSSL